MKFTGSHAGRELESQLRSMPSTAGSVDLSCSILSQVNAARPFVNRRTQMVRRWARVVAGALGLGVLVCGGVTLAYAPEVIPGMEKKPTPISGVVASWNAERTMSVQACRRAPDDLVYLAKSLRPRRNDQGDMPMVRVMSRSVLQPAAVALRVVPSTDLSVSAGEPTVVYAAMKRGIVIVDRAGRAVTNLGASNRGRGEWRGETSGTFVDRFERAVGGRETPGPQ